MELDECKKCSYHFDFIFNQVHCRYWGTYTHSIVSYENVDRNIIIIGCPKELTYPFKNPDCP